MLTRRRIAFGRFKPALGFLSLFRQFRPGEIKELRSIELVVKINFLSLKWNISHCFIHLFRIPVDSSPQKWKERLSCLLSYKNITKRHQFLRFSPSLSLSSFFSDKMRNNGLVYSSKRKKPVATTFTFPHNTRKKTTISLYQTAKPKAIIDFSVSFLYLFWGKWERNLSGYLFSGSNEEKRETPTRPWPSPSPSLVFSQENERKNSHISGEETRGCDISAIVCKVVFSRKWEGKIRKFQREVRDL